MLSLGSCSAIFLRQDLSLPGACQAGRLSGLWASGICVSSSRQWDYQCVSPHRRLGTELGSLGLQGRHFTNWAISSALGFSFSGVLLNMLGFKRFFSLQQISVWASSTALWVLGELLHLIACSFSSSCSFLFKKLFMLLSYIQSTVSSSLPIFSPPSTPPLFPSRKGQASQG